MRVTPRWLPPPRALQRPASGAARPARCAARASAPRRARPGCVTGADRIDDRDVKVREIGLVPVASSRSRTRSRRRCRGRASSGAAARSRPSRPSTRWNARSAETCVRQSRRDAARRISVELPLERANVPSTFTAASRAASSSSTARTGNTGSSCVSSTARTRAPRNGSDSTRRRSWRSRRRLAHRSLARAELPREPRLDEPLAGLELAAQDALEQDLLHLLSKDGALDRRARRHPARDDRVRERADALDLDRDLVARLQQPLRIAEDTDSRGSAGEDQVAGLEGHRLRRVTDDLVDAEDEVRRRRVLEHLAAHDRADAEVVRVRDLRRRHELPGRPGRRCRATCRASTGRRRTAGRGRSRRSRRCSRARPRARSPSRHGCTRDPMITPSSAS